MSARGPADMTDAELDAVLARVTGGEPADASSDALEAAAAAYYLVRAPRPAEHQMPDALAARILTQASAKAAIERLPAANDASWLSRLGWPAAAAALALALLGWVPRLAPPGEQPQTVAATPMPAFATMQATGDPLGESLTGQVFWDSAQQRGELQLSGLAVNDPGQLQYQLWIFDARREPHPVDGGVFNSTAGDVITVPVQAKLPVYEAAAFAITAERPGGVVVSDQSRVVGLAKPDPEQDGDI